MPVFSVFGVIQRLRDRKRGSINLQFDGVIWLHCGFLKKDSGIHVL